MISSARSASSNGCSGSLHKSSHRHCTHFAGTYLRQIRTSRGLTVKRGDVVFNMPQARTVKNAGSSEAHFFRVEFPSKGAQDSWGTTGLSPNYKLLFENAYARAYDIRIPAGVREPQHTHHDCVVVCLNGAELEPLFPDGHKEPSTLKTGEVAFRAGSTHIGRNIGRSDLWVIAIEPK